MQTLEVALFWLAIAGYVVGSVAHIHYLAYRDNRVLRFGMFVVPVAWALHMGSITVRGISVGHVPLGTLFEFMSVFSWAVIGIFLMVQRSSHLPSLGAFLVPLGWLLMGVAWLSYSAPQPLPPELQSSWFVVHISVAFLAYASFTVAFGIAVAYLMQERIIKTKSGGMLFRRLPPLETLDHLSYRSIVFGFPLLTLALVSGMIWAEQTWGRYWIWEPKLTSALVTWLIFAAYLHAHVIAGWQGRRAAWLATIGFLAVLFTFGISFFVGPHGLEGLTSSGG